MQKALLEVLTSCSTCLSLLFERSITSPANGGAQVVEYEVLAKALLAGASEDGYLVPALAPQFLLSNLKRGVRYQVNPKFTCFTSTKSTNTDANTPGRRAYEHGTPRDTDP
jgi:hypothetical protein